ERALEARPVLLRRAAVVGALHRQVADVHVAELVVVAVETVACVGGGAGGVLAGGDALERGVFVQPVVDAAAIFAVDGRPTAFAADRHEVVARPVPAHARRQVVRRTGPAVGER